MNRKSRMLLVTFAVLAGVVLLVAFWPSGKGGAELRVPGWSPGSKSEKAEEDAPFDRIEVTLDGATAVLARGKDKAWTLTPPQGARPDKYKVRQIVELLRDDLVSVLPSSPKAGELASFGLDDAQRVTVTFHRPDAADVVLQIGTSQKPDAGDKGAPGEGDSFVQVGKDPRVWRVLGRDLRRPFEGGAKGLRDRKLFAFDASDVASVQIQDPAAADTVDRDVRLVSDAPATPPAPKDAKDAKPADAAKKPERTWRFEAPAGLAAGDVRTYLSAVAGIYAQEYVDALPAGVAIGDDAFSVALGLADGKAVHLRLSPLKDDAAYVQVDGLPGYAKVAKYVYEQLRKHTGDLRDRKLLGIQRDDVKAVDLVDGGKRLAFVREGNGFKSVAPAGLPLGRSLVDTFLTDLQNLRADAFLSPSQREGAATGLDAPILTLAVTTLDGGHRVLEVGADKGSGTRYVTIRGSGDVATLPAWALTRIRKSPDDLRNKTFFDFDAAKVKRIEVAESDQTLVLERQDNPASPDMAWKAVQPTETTDLKPEAVGTIVGTVGGFAAKAVASDAEARKAVAGKPQFTLTAVLDDGSRHVLKVFAQKKDGNPYAVTPTEPGFKDLVLVLNAWQVKNVDKRLAELKK